MSDFWNTFVHVAFKADLFSFSQRHQLTPKSAAQLSSLTQATSGVATPFVVGLRFDDSNADMVKGSVLRCFVWVAEGRSKAMSFLGIFDTLLAFGESRRSGLRLMMSILLQLRMVRVILMLVRLVVCFVTVFSRVVTESPARVIQSSRIHTTM